MSAKSSFKNSLSALRLQIEEVVAMVGTTEERRALSKLLASQLHVTAQHTRQKERRGQLRVSEGSGVANLAMAADTALKGQPAPKKILSHILRAMRELDVLP